MKKLFCILFVITTSLLFGCTPDSPASSGTSSPFTLKYEITTSVPVTIIGGVTSSFSYTNGTGQSQTDQTFTSGSSWTKELTVTTPNRPFMASLSGAVILSASGTATGKIYVNGVEVASVTNSSSGNNIVTIPMSYPIY